MNELQKLSAEMRAGGLSKYADKIDAMIVPVAIVEPRNRVAWLEDAPAAAFKPQTLLYALLTMGART